MSALRTPIKTSLRSVTTSAAVARMWGRIEARGRTGGPRRRTTVSWAIAVALVLLAASAVAAIGVARHRRVLREPHPPAPAASAGAREGKGDGSAGDALDRVAATAPPTVTASAAPSGTSTLDPIPSIVRTTPSVNASAPPPSPATPSETWRALAAKGENDRAYAALGADGVAAKARATSVDDLFALADVARLSGHAAEAVAPLEAIVVDHGSDPRSSLAALTLGRVQLRSLGIPSAASRSFEQAIALGVPAALAEDTYALWIESLARAGDRVAAGRVFDRFVARFPESPRTEPLRDWTRDP